MPPAAGVADSLLRVSAVSVLPADGIPLLVVTDVAARLVRRGLLAPSEAGAERWCGARVLVFRHGPVVCEPPAGAWGLGAHGDVLPARTR